MLFVHVSVYDISACVHQPSASVQQFSTSGEEATSGVHKEINPNTFWRGAP